MLHCLLKNAPDAEVEPCVAIVTDRACYQNRTEDRIDEKSCRGIHRKIWRTRTGGEFVRLSHLHNTKEVHRAPEQRWQVRQLSDVAYLSKEVLVCEQLIGAPGYQPLRATKREGRYAGLVAVATTAIGTYKYRRWLVQAEEVLRLNLSHRKGARRSGIDRIPLCVS